MISTRTLAAGPVGEPRAWRLGVAIRFAIGLWLLTASSPAGAAWLQAADPPAKTGAGSETAEDRDPEGALVRPAIADEISVEGIRAGEALPVTQRTLGREEIEQESYGQDMPALLQFTPSMTWYSDAGTGSNYSYFSLRGIQQSRINMTFDGAPLSDPAEHALFFTNFHDFSSAVDSVQIQRGVGTSSVGAPSYGGSVNFASRPPAAQRGGEARLVLGSYGTERASVGYESGVLANGFWASGRVSTASTDGYREGSGTDHRTLFLNAGWQGERSALKFVSFSGDVESQLSFLAVDPDTLRDNRRFNPLAEEERDDFGQDFAQLKYTRALASDTLITASLYYNGASGWFRLWSDPVARDDLLQFGIDQSFVGSMVTASWSIERLATTLGVHVNDFSGDHTLDIGSERLYTNTGLKKTASAFAKLEYSLDRWLLFGDLQGRRAEFSYQGDIDLGKVSWNFLDLKLGARRDITEQLSLYASLGRAQREPTRMDLLLGEDNATIRHDLETVRPEEVVDLELGLNLRAPRLALQANVYAMEFTDEIALTGELSPIGLPLRRNVDQSYRRGIEADLRWRLKPEWSLLASANLSRNRIRQWTQFYDVYDEAGAWIASEPIAYRDVEPLLSPEAIVNLGGVWSDGEASLRLMVRHVSAAQLDNTGLDAFRVSSYTNVDLRASRDLGRFWSAAHPRVTLTINNLFDRDDQFPSGYSYQFINRDASGQDSFDGIPFFYPLATRSAMLALELDL